MFRTSESLERKCCLFQDKVNPLNLCGYFSHVNSIQYLPWRGRMGKIETVPQIVLCKHTKSFKELCENPSSKKCASVCSRRKTSEVFINRKGRSIFPVLSLWGCTKGRQCWFPLMWFTDSLKEKVFTDPSFHSFASL